jgi:hypothetical protein
MARWAEKLREKKEKQRDYIAKRRDVVKESAEQNSEIISQRVRVISLAVLGTCWALLIGRVTTSSDVNGYPLSMNLLLWPMGMSVLALLFDLLQYALYQFSTTIYLSRTCVFSEAEQKELYDTLRKDQEWKPAESVGLNQAALVMFVSKCLLSVAGAIVFLVIVITAFYLQ